MNTNPKGSTMTNSLTLLHRTVTVDRDALDELDGRLLRAASALEDVCAAVRPFREAFGLSRRELAQQLDSTLTESVLAAVEAGNRSLLIPEALALVAWMRNLPDPNPLPFTPRYTGTEVSNHPESENPDDRF